MFIKAFFEAKIVTQLVEDLASLLEVPGHPKIGYGMMPHACNHNTLR